MAQRCLLECPQKEGRTLHLFPKNPVRRAQWLKIIDMETDVKRIYLCGEHFSEGQIFGKKVNMFAIPDRNLTPKWKCLKSPHRSHNLKNSSLNTGGTVQQLHSDISSDNIYPVYLSVSQEHSTTDVPNKISSKTFTNSISKASQEPIITNMEREKSQINAISDPLNIEQEKVGENHSSKNEELVENEVNESCIKSEDFEIRHRSSNGIILKGRYVQSADNSIISYTIPNDFSLKQQVDNLLVTSKTQKRKLKILKSERLKLSKQLKKNKEIFLKIKNDLAKRNKKLINLAIKGNLGNKEIDMK